MRGLPPSSVTSFTHTTAHSKELQNIDSIFTASTHQSHSHTHTLTHTHSHTHTQTHTHTHTHTLTHTHITHTHTRITHASHDMTSTVTPQQKRAKSLRISLAHLTHHAHHELHRHTSKYHISSPPALNQHPSHITHHHHHHHHHHCTRRQVQIFENHRDRALYTPCFTRTAAHQRSTARSAAGFAAHTSPLSQVAAAAACGHWKQEAAHMRRKSTHFLVPRKFFFFFFFFFFFCARSKFEKTLALHNQK